MPGGLIRRGITIVLAVTASAMLGASPLLIGVFALVLVTVGPLAWKLLVRRYSVHLGEPAEPARV